MAIKRVTLRLLMDHPNFFVLKVMRNSIGLNLLFHRDTFLPVANSADPDKAALIRAARSESTLFAYRHIIYLILR